MYFREFLGNLTRGMYILNDDFHKESSTRYQDVHNLALELGTIKQDMALLQSSVNKLLGLPVTQNTSVSNPVVATTGSSVPLQQQQPCTGTGRHTQGPISNIYEPRHVISSNVVFWQVSTLMSLCSLILSLETPNDVRSVA